MAVQESYTLEDFENYAREEFPVAFEAVANPELYSFSSRRFSTDTGGTQESAVLHIAFWYSEKLDIRVWAHSNGMKVQYFYEKPETPLMSISPPYQDEGRMLMNTFQGPFAYLPVRKKPQSRDRELVAQIKALTRKRFAFLVHFAFLVAGRVNAIGNSSQIDLCVELKDTCMHLYGNQIADIGAHGSGQTLEEDKKVISSVGAVSTPSETGNSGLSMLHDAFRKSHSISIRTLKRPVPMQDDDRHDAIQKRTKTDGISNNVNTLEQEEPSPQLQSIFKTLVGGCKAEAEGRWAQEKEAFLQQIHELKAQLQQAEEGTRKAEVESGEWKEKYEKLKEKLARLMGDD